jgi:Protein of unknown function (DUF3822)
LPTFTPTTNFSTLDKVYSVYQHQSAVFQPERLKQYHLRLLLRENLAQYAVVSEQGKIMAVKEYRSKVPLDFADFFDAFCLQDGFVKEQYASTSVLYGDPVFSLVPTSMFEEAQLAALAEATLGPGLDLAHIDHHDLPAVGATAVFALPFAVKQKCDHHLRKPTYLSASHHTIQMAASLAKAQPDLLLLTILGQRFVLTVFKGGKLHLCNAYAYTGITDIVYFTQLAVETTKLELGRAALYVQGEFEKDSELLRQLTKFIPALRIPE